MFAPEGVYDLTFLFFLAAAPKIFRIAALFYKLRFSRLDLAIQQKIRLMNQTDGGISGLLRVGQIGRIGLIARMRERANSARLRGILLPLLKPALAEKILK